MVVVEGNRSLGQMGEEGQGKTAVTNRKEKWGRNHPGVSKSL